MNLLKRHWLRVLVAAWAVSSLGPLVLVWSSAASAAETRRLEVVGTMPIGPSHQASVAPRDAAINQALREAVVRVAQEFLADRLIELPDADDVANDVANDHVDDLANDLDRGRIDYENRDPEPGSAIESELGSGDLEPDSPDLDAVLGKQMVPYTLRFRVIEDRGRRPALFAEDPEVSEEYVVIVEVQVDVDRVQAKLVDAGLIPAGVISVGSNEVRLEVEGLTVYPAYLALRELLEDALGATAVLPVEMGHGRTVLDVETQTSAVEFLEQLLAVAPPEIKIVPLHASGNRVHVIANWTPPAEPSPEVEVDDPGDDAAPARRGR